MDSGPLGLFQQLPVGIILMFCGSCLLLLIATAYILRTRSLKAQAAVPAMAGMSPSIMNYDSGSGDLPDLDSFGSTDSFKSAAPARSGGAYTIHLSEGEMVEAVEVLTILRDVAEGGLIIRIGDKAYRNPPGVADAEFKRRFHSTLRDLNGAQNPVGVKPAPVVSAAPPPAPAAPVAPPAPAPAAATAPVDENAPLDEPDFDSPAFSAPPPPRNFSSFPPAPGDLPKFKMPDGPPVKPKRGQRPVAEPIPEINIAASIEAFLQHKLSMTPQYVLRSIHVRPAAHGAVAIEVDGKFFDSVGEVDDTAVRSFLSSTIEEWQARQ